jgi:hypothetical protein
MWTPYFLALGILELCQFFDGLERSGHIVSAIGANL